MKDTKLRFSDRVSYYVRSRPHYPQTVVSYMREHCRLQEISVIADIGSGTGILSELFLRNGNTVFGIEPNREMRVAGEDYLRQYSRFHSIDGNAENTTLPDSLCDLVVAGQAFHWFDAAKARAEFLRILKPGGEVALLWNERMESSLFETEYENLLIEFGTDYKQVDHRRLTPADFAEFFGTSQYGTAAFEHQQVCDFEKLQDRLLSCSYVPLQDDDRFNPMIDALKALFARHQQSGAVVFTYITRLYHHALNAA